MSLFLDGDKILKEVKCFFKFAMFYFLCDVGEMMFDRNWLSELAICTLEKPFSLEKPQREMWGRRAQFPVFLLQ